jgi:hypothetical protein
MCEGYSTKYLWYGNLTPRINKMNVLEMSKNNVITKTHKDEFSKKNQNGGNEKESFQAKLTN